MNRGSGLLIVALVALLVGACGESSPGAGGEATDTDSPTILSAYLGALDVPVLGVALLSNVSGCDQQPGDDGMPVVLSHPVAADTLDPTDFELRTAAGSTTAPTCATLEPATESDELQTVLLTGPLGSDDDRPVALSIVGEVLAIDGTVLTGLKSEDIDTFEDGAEIVLAKLDPAGEVCLSLGSTHEIQTTWQGGVTGQRGSEPGAAELDGFSVVDTDGVTHSILGFDDLGDGDNYVVVCLPPGVDPSQIDVQPATLFDPTNNPNPTTSAEVVARR